MYMIYCVEIWGTMHKTNTHPILLFLSPSIFYSADANLIVLCKLVTLEMLCVGGCTIDVTAWLHLIGQMESNIASSDIGLMKRGHVTCLSYKPKWIVQAIRNSWRSKCK